MRRVLLAVLLLGSANGALYAKNQTEKPEEKTQVTKENTNKDSGVKIEDIKVGEGSGIHAGQKITVHYTGTLENGAIFDCSRKRGQTFDFVYGVGQVIPGWEEGLKTMKVGGRRKITIPPEMGYGDAAVGSIPANSTLIFDVELIAAK